MLSKKDISVENLWQFAYTNEALLNNNIIEGIVLYFHGLGEQTLIKEHDENAKIFAEDNILYIIPFYGPWSWMNDGAVKTVDRVLDIVVDKFNISRDIPIISSGFSMGGLSALTYPRFSKYREMIKAAAANCPVCDLISLRDNREDIPRTTFYAFAHYDMDMDEAVKTVSPVHNINKMPDIPYFIAHCKEDTDVPIKEHSDIMVKLMREHGFDITYIEVPDRGHVNLDEDTFNKFIEFIKRNIAENRNK